MLKNKNGRTSGVRKKNKFVLLSTITICLLLSLIGGYFSVASIPAGVGYALTPSGTAIVGQGIGKGNGEDYKYTGVNSMVGTLISWGESNYTTTTTTIGSWYIDNNGYIVWGSSGTGRKVDVTYAVPKNNSLNMIHLIKAVNGSGTVPGQILTSDGKTVTIDNLVQASDGLGAYFTIGANGHTEQEMADDWEKAIVAASYYSKSGILQNPQFGTVSSVADTEFPSNEAWAADYNKAANAGFGKQHNTGISNNTYIYIKLMADWGAPIVNTMTVGGTQKLPGDGTTYLNRFVEEARCKTEADVAAESGVTKARGVGFFEFDLGSNGAGNTLQTGSSGKYTFGDEEGATKESGPHFSLGTSFSNRNSISNLHNSGIAYNQFAQVPSEEPFSFGRLAIPDNCYVIIDLNGHKLDRNLDAVDETIHKNVICPSVFLAGAYSRLEVFDSSASADNPAGNGKIMGATGINGDALIDGCPPDYATRRTTAPAWDINAWGNSLKGGGVKLGPRAEFTLHSGTITESSAIYGGAVYGTDNNYIYIYDGVMTGNTACKGGATYLSSDSRMVFNMFGGSVSGNGADWRRFTRYIHVKDATQVKDESVAIPAEWQKSGAGTGVREFGVNEEGKVFNKAAWGNVVNYSESTPKQNVKSGEINSEGGGVCVFKNTYFNMYGGTIAYNYSYEYAGGVNVNNISYFKMYGGEIIDNVVTGEIQKINGATISEKGPDGTVTHSTPEANVGGGGVNMFQDSAGIYLNGPGRITNNYTCDIPFDFGDPFTLENLANYLTTNADSLVDSNLYLSLTKSDHTQVDFDATKHLYPEIKVQGPLYLDAEHFAQVSITPAAGIEAGGYIMRQFLKAGWEDDNEKQGNHGDGASAPKWLGEDETDHAKDQIGVDGTTAFNVNKYLSTGATTGYVDGFLFTDGGTSIVEGSGTDEGWYLALGTKDAKNLPVEWQYFDNTIGEDGLQKGWTVAKTSAETGTGFSLVYNGEDRKYNIRVRLDRSQLIGGDTESHLSKYYFLYYDYYTTYETQPDGSYKEGDIHYRYYADGSKSKIVNILEITSGHYIEGENEGEAIVQEEAKYASDRYDRLGYRFTINPDIKNCETEGDGSPAPFHKTDDFQANPNYATMKIERATLMVSQLTLTDIVRYYDGTQDFYIPSDKIQAGTLTGYAAEDQSFIRMQFLGQEHGYVKGQLESPDVGSTTVRLNIRIEEVGRENQSHDHHTEKSFPNDCILLNYTVYDQNSGTTTDAEDQNNIPVTLNVIVRPKPITVLLEKQTYEYGSIPLFDAAWGTHSGTANWAETYGNVKGDGALTDLFAPVPAPALGTDGFSPDFLGTDGKLAQVDIDSTGLVSAGDKDNLALRLDQILKITFNSTYGQRSEVGDYNGSFSYTNGNYAVTWKLGESEVPGMSEGGILSPAEIEDVIGITKRKISATIPNASSIYGEAQATLSLPDANVKHKDDDAGEGLVFGDKLGATLGLSGAVNVPTSNMLRVTRQSVSGAALDAAGKGYYDIIITNPDGLNKNYELIDGDIVTGQYAVYPRKIVLTANPYNSVYGERIDPNMGGFDYRLDTQEGGLSTTSTVILPVDQTAFNKGISYSYSEVGEHKNTGTYSFNVAFNPALTLEGDVEIGVNYAVRVDAAATHTVEARRISVAIFSNDQSSEYGEVHTPRQDVNVCWQAQSVFNGTGDVVVAGDELRIELYLADSVNEQAPAGIYPIMGRYDPSTNSNNYVVEFVGSWSGDAPDGYADEDYDTDKHAGVYTITRRTISLSISQNLSSEYGDDLTEFWTAAVCTLTRPAGGLALIGEDYLTLAPELFSLNITGYDNIVGGSDNTKFANYQLQTGSYAILFDSAAYKASESYKTGVNANYEIQAENGLYVVEPRRIKVQIGVELPEGDFQLNPAMEYGETFTYGADETYAAPKRKAQVTRITEAGEPSGKGGDGFLGDDYQTMVGEYLAEVESIGNYTSGLTGNGHLRVGVYTFTVQTSLVSANYRVTWVFGKLTVNARNISVVIREQSTAYTGVEPNVSNGEWDYAPESKQLAAGDKRDIVTLDKTDGAEAGRYDITLTCTDSNYRFTVVGGTGEGLNVKADAFVITPTVVTFALTGENVVYDAQSHLHDITFNGDGLTPVHHALTSGTVSTDAAGNVTYTFSDNVYTVRISYSGDFGTRVENSDGHKNVGTYTVKVTLLHTGTFGDEDYTGNFCFSFDEHGASIYESEQSYQIEKATIRLSELAPKPYNRAEQTADWSFVNEVNTTVLPDARTYTAENGIQYTTAAVSDNDNAQLGANLLPYYRGKYTFTLTLHESDFRNFTFASGQTEQKEFEITPLEIFGVLTSASEEYDDTSRFHGDTEDGRHGAWSFTFVSMNETPVEGISYNLSFTYTGWGIDGDDEGEHTILIKVGGYEGSDSHERAATQYFVDDNPSDATRIAAILLNIRAFIDAGVYRITLSFEYKNFLLRETTGAETTSSITYDYTITPVLLSLGSFANKEFNNEPQEPTVNETTFLPTYTMSGATAYTLLQQDYNRYTLTYAPTDFLTTQNNAELKDGLPFNAGTYTVTVTLQEGGNFAFGSDDRGYIYIDSVQRFVIDPFNIGTLFSIPEELPAVHAFEGELDGTLINYDGVMLHTYTYTGLEIIPVLKKATVRLTVDGEPIVYDQEGDLAKYFSLGTFSDNVQADAMSHHHAGLVVTGQGNYTGTTTMSFSIQPMALTAKVGTASSVYGEPIAFDAATLIEYTGEARPYEADSLNYTFTLADEAKKGEHVLAGTYAIEVACGNANYTVTFTGEWFKEGDELHNAKCGIYTVERRQIIIQIDDQTFSYTGSRPELVATKWRATHVLFGTGSPILDGDTLSIALSIEGEHSTWDAGTYTITGTLADTGDGKNYEVNEWLTGTMTIRAIDVVVTLHSQTREYDGTVKEPEQGASYYDIDSGAAVGGENLANFIELYIVNPAKNAREYQLMGRSTSVNYHIEFGAGSTYTITARELEVAIRDAESYYGEQEVELGAAYYTVTHRGETDGAIIDGDELAIALMKAAGFDANTYNITGSWNNNPDYALTFTGSREGTMGAYTVKRRPITVRINNQEGVYGNISNNTLSQDEGIRSAWSVTGFSLENAEDVGLTGNFVYGSDVLGIVLHRDEGVEPKTYSISGTCSNTNYDVTFVGDGGETGTYTVSKRAVQLTVLTQTGVYGDAKSVSQNLGVAYSITCTNATNGVTFVEDDNVTLKFETVSDLSAVGQYPIYVTITFGVSEHEDWYIVTVETGGVKQDDGRYLVANAYEVERRGLQVMISDLSSVYGDSLKALSVGAIVSPNAMGSAILEGDDAAVRAEILAHLQIMLEGMSAGSGVLDAGTYDIEGTSFISTNGNYDVSFNGSNGGKGVYTVEKRAISIAIQNATSVYGTVGDYDNDEGVRNALDATFTMAGRTTNGVDPTLTNVGEDDLGISLYLTTNGAYSTSRHLKMGNYYISGRSSEEEHITKNYDIFFVLGTYTVEQRRINIALATDLPESEYGDDLVPQTKWGYEATLSFGSGEAILADDVVAFTMTTTLKKGDEVGTAPVNATLQDGDNDNANYNIAWTPGYYRISPRVIVVTVNAIAPVEYGTAWAQPGYDSKRAAGKAGEAILDKEVNIRIDVQGADYSETGYLRYREGGYNLTASVTGEKSGNYSVTIENLTTGKYVVQKRHIQITIADATLVYGESASGESALTFTAQEGRIVEGNGTRDNLQINLLKADAGNNVGKYRITGECHNGDYEVEWLGAWMREGDSENNGKCGTYEITRREVHIVVLNQTHAVYGESMSVRAPQESVTFTYADPTPYQIATGDRPEGVFEFVAYLSNGEDEWDGVSALDASNYTLSARKINDNYIIVVETRGKFLVNRRKVVVTIFDQYGVYGEENAVDQTQYSLANGMGSSGNPMVGKDSFRFSFTSDASTYKAGKGSYPIHGSAVAEGSTNAGNYDIEYRGTYGTGNEGTYTLSKRTIVVTITDQSVVYGGSGTEAQLIPTLAALYTAAYNGETGNAILPGDEVGLMIRFTLQYDLASDLSKAGALKAGSYAIVGSYGTGDENANYVISFVGSWDKEDYHSTAGTLHVEQRGVTVSLGLDGSIFSYYGDKPEGPWTQDQTSMYVTTLTSGNGPAILSGDVIQFTMSTLATEQSDVGIYPLIGQTLLGAGDNDNYNISFTGGFSSDDAFASYSGQAGIYNVSPRKVTAVINSYTREYGERVDNATVLSALKSDGSNGVYFTLPDDWSKNGDTVEELGVTLNCGARLEDGAQTYTITGSVSNPNYDVKFVDGEGKYVIIPRVVYIVILPQVSVYGDEITENQTMWYAFRAGKKAIWAGINTLDEGGVLAPGENLDVLKVRLTKRGAIDGYEFSEGNGTYGGQYAIEGDYNNANYSLIFVGANVKQFFRTDEEFKEASNVYYQYNMFTSSDRYDYDLDPDGIKEQEFGTSGIYTVAPRKVTIGLKEISGAYGSTAYTRYGEGLKKGVELDPTQNTVWEYDFGSEQIDAGHTGYLSFYLGGKFDEAGEKYLIVGDYPIVAYWGLSLGTKSRMRDWNYAITFHGNWTGSLNEEWRDAAGNIPENRSAGKFGVTNAIIQQYGPWYEALEFLLDHDAQPYMMAINPSMVATGTSRTEKQALIFQGDIKEATSVTYGQLYFNPTANSKVGVVPSTTYDKDAESGAPKVNDAGYWILEVTVRALYHDEAKFELVYRITPDLIVLTLSEEASYLFTYGEYLYDADEGAHGFDALERALKSWLLSTSAPVVTAMRVEGKDVAAADLASRLEDINLNDEVVVSVHKMASNRSSGGYLNAGRYLVTISGGSNLEITFAQDYEIIQCQPKTVGASWEELTGYATRGVYDEDGAVLFNVVYDARQHTLDPGVDGVLPGDITTDYAATSYLFADGRDGAPATPLGYGYYVCRVTSRALGGADGSNYAVPEGLHAYIFVEKRGITVLIKDRAHHIYGESEAEFGADDWDLEASSFMAQGEQKSVLGVVLTRTRGKDVGTYKVSGQFYNDNYAVTWKGSWSAADDADNGTCGTFTIDPRPITVTLLDKTVTYGTDLPFGEDLASDITLWYATYDHNVRGIAILQGDDIRLTMQISYTSADCTSTGYLKAKSYVVTPGWDNDNYDVTFTREAEPAQSASRYIVEERALRVSLFDALPTEYGYARPGISHAFTGFTSGDQIYFDEHPEALFIAFYFFDPRKDMRLDPSAPYDAVGTYAVCGEVTDPFDEIGANYRVDFVGSWDNNTYPDLVKHAGVYLVTPRSISILISSVESEYGDIAFVPITLQPGSPELVGSDTLEGLGIRYRTDAYYGTRTNRPGTYPIEYESISNPNYRVSGALSLNATYTVKPRRIRLVVSDQRGEYGDEHLLGSVQGVNWRAVRVDAEGRELEGDGIAYDDDLLCNLRVTCYGITPAQGVGRSALSASFDTDGCYEIFEAVYGVYEITPREIVVHVYSYEDEYGEDHAARFRDEINISGRGFYFERLNGTDNAIAFPTDPMYNFHLALDITKETHIGDYAILCVYRDDNYRVTIQGDYIGEGGVVLGGTYTVRPRAITVLLRDQSGEYGDEHILANVFGVNWTATRVGGGVAIVGADDLGLTLSTSAMANSGVNGSPYYIDADWTNTDYELTIIEGNYIVTPRKLTASVYGESEYGDPLQELHLVLSRTTEGLGGEGIMPWDTDFLSINATCDVYPGAAVGEYPVTYTITGDLGADRNYEIVNSDEGKYVILPRAVVVDIDDVLQTYGDPLFGVSALSYTVSRAGEKSGDAILNGEIEIVLRVQGLNRNAGSYVIDIEEIHNSNYRVIVHAGTYTIAQKRITVHIKDQSSVYGDEPGALGTETISGVLEGDELGLSLSVLWGDTLAWHNVGTYPIVASCDNGNYFVTYEGSWQGSEGACGTYTVNQATNTWLKDYTGDGTLTQGSAPQADDAPKAKFGTTLLKYYYDEACTQEVAGDITGMDAGVYYVKAYAEGTANYTGIEQVFRLEVLSAFIYPSESLDVTLYVCVFASQFVIGICALLFIRRRKNKENPSKSEGNK